jgi:rhodanese-related sulfurtransferase
MASTFLGLFLALLWLSAPPVQAAGAEAGRVEPASGRIVDGYRVLTVPRDAGPRELTVYRGDYVKFHLEGAQGETVLSIPGLAIDRRLPAGLSEAPFFKMEQTGVFAFALGDATGRLAVVEYRQQNYREVSAPEAAELIQTNRPLILDVRTPAEFGQVRLADALLIPVQELQRRWREVEGFRDRDILVYCATGNRSTVASKILIDNGFTRIHNMRRGIAEWRRGKYPIQP